MFIYTNISLHERLTHIYTALRNTGGCCHSQWALPSMPNVFFMGYGRKQLSASLKTRRTIINESKFRWVGFKCILRHCNLVACLQDILKICGRYFSQWVQQGPLEFSFAFDSFMPPLLHLSSSSPRQYWDKKEHVRFPLPCVHSISFNIASPMNLNVTAP